MNRKQTRSNARASRTDRKHFRLLITGSRTWDKPDVIKKLLVKVYNEVKDRDPILVHGTARGADEMSSKIWLELGGAVEAHPADWDQFGKQAGFVRNQQMVDLGANLCIAFIKDNSRGASNCARLAEKAGIKTWRITDEG